MKISLDIDGVITNLCGRCNDLLKEQYNLDVAYEQVISWDYYRDLIGEEKTAKLFVDAWENPKLIMPMESGLFLKIENIKQFGEVFAVTVRQGIGDMIKVLEWIHNYRLEIEGVLAAHYKLGWDKTRFGFFDCFIDDAPHAIEGAIKMGNIAICRDQPWNRFLDEKYKIDQEFFRITSLSQVPNILKAWKHA